MDIFAPAVKKIELKLLYFLCTTNYSHGNIHSYNRAFENHSNPAILVLQHMLALVFFDFASDIMPATHGTRLSTYKLIPRSSRQKHYGATTHQQLGPHRTCAGGDGIAELYTQS